MTPLRLEELPDRLFRLGESAAKIAGLWYVRDYWPKDRAMAVFLLAFSLLSIAAVLAACLRAAARLCRRTAGGMELLLCLSVVSIAAVCASVLLFQIKARSVYLFVWYLLISLSVAFLLSTGGRRTKRLVLLLFCAAAAANLYFSYKDSLRCSLDPDFKNTPSYCVEAAGELVSRDIEILYGPAFVTCDICGLTDGRVLASPWWRVPFEALEYIAPQDLRRPEDNRRAAYLLIDSQKEEALRLAEEQGAQLTLIRGYGTIELYTSSIQLMH